MGICQLQNKTNSILLISFSTIMLFGCAETPVIVKKEPNIVIEAEWNKLPPRFAHSELNKTPVVHPFFDIDPKIENFSAGEWSNYGIRYVTSTPEQSKYQYELNMYSGKLFKTRTYCAQDDIWKSYSGDLLLPNFTQGFIPRVFDENKNPQQIIVFSTRAKNEVHAYDDARIVGGLLTQYCEIYPCDKKDRWKDSEVLVAVDTKDPEFNLIDSFTTLKNKVDWNYAKAMMANMKGVHGMSERLHQSYRITKELGLADTKKYFIQKSKILKADDFKVLNEQRVGCMKLYDDFWNESEKIRKLPKRQSAEFLKYFSSFYPANVNELTQCLKLTRPGNIADDPRRLWFFAMIEGFSILEKNGFYYNCKQRSWTYNPKNDEGQFTHNAITELGRCRVQDYERAFNQIINGMSLLKNYTNLQYHFVEFDNSTGGTGEKIYSWLFDRPQNLACKDRDEVQTQDPFVIFPHDVEWEFFKQDETEVAR